MMFKVVKKIQFSYAHRLLGYAGKCRHLHGHNGVLEVEVSAEELDGMGMATDFADVGAVVKGWVDSEWDHTLILNEADPLVPLLRAAGERLATLPGNPTAEAMARLDTASLEPWESDEPPADVADLEPVTDEVTLVKFEPDPQAPR